MSQRKMFSPQIIGSDAFIEMPVSARELYFQLGMYADDDGFINPKKIIRMVSASDDDLRVLIGKRFVLPFESGVVVIKHWLIHNLIRADMYQETQYKKEKALLGLNENGAYTELREGIAKIKLIEAPEWLKRRRSEVLCTVYGTQSARKDRLGKDRLGKDSIVATEVATERLDTKIVDYFFLLKGWDTKNPPKRTYAGFLRAAKDLLDICENNVEDAKNKINTIKEWAESRELDWSIETVFKKWYDLPFLAPKEKKPFYDGMRMFKGTDDRWRVIEKTGEIKLFNDSETKIVYK